MGWQRLLPRPVPRPPGADKLQLLVKPKGGPQRAWTGWENAISALKWIDENGLKPGSYTLFAAGATNNKLAAVVAGQVAAAPLYPPANFVAKQQGLVEIFNTSQLKFGQVPTFYEVRRSWASQRPVAVVNVIRALNKAHNWLFDRANRAEAIQILVKNTSVAADIAEMSYDLFFTTPGKIYSKNGEWDANVVKKVGDELVTLGLLTAPPPTYESTVAPEYRG